MFDSTNGTIAFDEPPASIGPSFTRSALLATDLGRNAKTLVQNEPWHSWSLAYAFHHVLSFTVSLFFKAEHLNAIQLCNADPRFPRTWNEWSRDAELHVRKHTIGGSTKSSAHSAHFHGAAFHRRLTKKVAGVPS